MIFNTYIVSVVFLHVVFAQTRIDPLVNTDVGLIRGLRANDGDYSMFLGIPFGKVNTAKPFSAATPYPKFENTFEAFNETIVCPQVEEYENTITGSLNCLGLNVYVPTTASSKNPLPVLVWIFGGGYRYGDGNKYLYGPALLVKKDIILVAINYRLGPYGFMCLDNPNVPGNQGLKDQLLAIRWINNHIAAFGGDPSKITISGESAGALSVGMHMFSNSEKLFRNAILQSGSPMVPRVVGSSGKAPIILAEYLGYPTNSIDDAVSFLEKVDSHLVIAAVDELNLHRFFRPCIEKKFEGVESFVTQNWITLDVPKVKNMPILFGINSDEAHFRHMSSEDEYYKNLNIVHENLMVAFDIEANGFKGMEDKVKHFYFGDQPMSAAVKRGVIDFDSDFTFIYPLYRSISKYLENDAGDIFLYLFSYSGERNYFKKFFNYTGATHSDGLGYLFDISYMKDKPVTPEDELIIDRMTTIWTNFVKFGNPSPQTSDLIPLQWTPIRNTTEIPFLNIDSQLFIGGRPFHQRVAFWDLFFKANDDYQIVYYPS